MGKYTIIADTSQKLIELLQQKLVPDVIRNPDEIGLRSPDEHGDVMLGLYLYDIRESEEIRQNGHAVVYREKLRKPSIYMNLFYMFTAYSSGDMKYRMLQEQRILGKVIQTFHEHPIIPIAEIEPDNTSKVDIRIELMRVSIDDKSKIWNFPNTGMRPSLFYRVLPIAIDSEELTGFTRVQEYEINLHKMK